MSKKEQNALKEQKEKIDVSILKVGLDISKEKLKQINYNLAKEKTNTAIAQEGVKGAAIKLVSAKLQNQIGEVGVGKLSDKLGYERASRILSQQEMMAKLQLQSISVEELREEVRHREVMSGQKAKATSIGGREGKIKFDKGREGGSFEGGESRSLGGGGSNDSSRRGWFGGDDN